MKTSEPAKVDGPSVMMSGCRASSKQAIAIAIRPFCSGLGEDRGREVDEDEDDQRFDGSG